MKKFFACRVVTFALLFSAFAVNGFAQKSVLPAAMPSDFEARFLESGGLSPKYNSKRLDGNTLYVETKAFESRELKEFFVKISKADKETLYKVFVENNFDLIKYETTDVYITDVITQSISLQAGGKRYSFQSNPNAPFSAVNEKRFGNVLQAIFNLESKYKSEKKEFKLDYVVLKLDSESLKNWVENAKPAELDKNEIATAAFFAKEAVFRDNDNPKYKRDLLPLENYKFQFVPFTDKGVNHVWVNAFCREPGIDWRNNLVAVDDGGSCYFNFKINLNPKNPVTYDLQINGKG